MIRQRRKPEKIKHFNSKMQATLLLVFCVIIVGFIGVLTATLLVSAKNGKKYTKRVLSQQTYVSALIPFRRGDITDRNGTVLATSVRVYNLVIDPVQMLTVDEDTGTQKYLEPTIEMLVKYFDVTEESIKQVLSDKPKSQYYILMKKVTAAQKKAFEDAVDAQNEAAKKAKTEEDLVQGVWFEDAYDRVYPLKEVACDVVGFSNDNNQGSSGIEESYNSYLNGTSGRTYGYYDSELKLQRTVKDAVDGDTIVSTIDTAIQSKVESHLTDFMNTTGCKNIACVVMNPKNGEILAMASYPFYDLNNPDDLSSMYTESEISAMSDAEKKAALADLWSNYCVTSGYEPGSTFKPFVVSAGLDDGYLTGNETFNCPGYYMVSGVKIRCAHKEGHGRINVGEAVAYSCNVALMQIAQRIGRASLYKYELAYGFGRKTGIDLPAESSGEIFTEDELNATELATSSFGQGITVTMVQMISAFSSLINNGEYYQPHIVKQILNANGAVVKDVDPILVKETVSAEVSSKLRGYMREAVTKGTATGAQVKGYDIGGKTGTAEKYPRGNGKYLVSFEGFVPVDDPKVAIYVIIDEPNVENQANSGLATKLTSKILKDILPLMSIYPEDSTDTTTQSEEDKQASTETDSDVLDTGVGDSIVSKPSTTQTEDPTTDYEP